MKAISVDVGCNRPRAPACPRPPRRVPPPGPTPLGLSPCQGIDWTSGGGTLNRGARFLYASPLVAVLAPRSKASRKPSARGHRFRYRDRLFLWDLALMARSHPRAVACPGSLARGSAPESKLPVQFLISALEKEDGVEAIEASTPFPTIRLPSGSQTEGPTARVIRVAKCYELALCCLSVRRIFTTAMRNKCDACSYWARVFR